MKKQDTAHQHDIVVRQDATEICVLAIDQRSAERLPLTLTLTYTIRLTNSNEEITGRTKTITVSGTGVEFPMTQMIPVASPCRITLTLPDQSDPLILTGRIGWCRQRQGIRSRGYAVGIAFSVSSNEATFVQYCHFIAAELLKRYLR